MNGNFLGIGADYACNASVQVDAAQAPGLLITNGEFTSFHDKSFAPNNTAGKDAKCALALMRSSYAILLCNIAVQSCYVI